MQIAVMTAAEWDRELIADLEPDVVAYDPAHTEVRKSQMAD